MEPPPQCTLLSFVSDGQVFSWGKSSRGRLGRTEVNSGIPQKVELGEEDSFSLLSISCNHGNTLLATKRKFSKRFFSARTCNSSKE